MSVGLIYYLCRKSYLNTPVPRPLSMCYSSVEKVVHHFQQYWTWLQSGAE